MSNDSFHPYADRHVNPNGAGDARPTALQVVQDEGLVGKLSDKVVIVTGAASGIGVETARAMHETGAKVYIMVRDTKKGQEVVDEILENSSIKADMGVIQIDLASLASVRKAAQEFLSKESKLNILINNAGVMAIPERTLSIDGHEQQFAANYLGHFLLFQLLKSTLLSSASPGSDSRVVVVSSSGHRTQPPQFQDLTFEKNYSPWGAYGQAKTATIWMSNEIFRRYSSQHLTSTSLNPGGIWTPLQRHVSKETQESWDKDPNVPKFMKSPEQGAATSVWAAIGKVWEGNGAKYLEDVGLSYEVDKSGDVSPGGYAAHAFDAEGAEKMWKVSCELTGVKDD
ncbi:NAD(P)-binding protein [Pseudovirgaria hyperparasitica]|uniref:NAD(P)-binding protein n=1 Tax=Pseudovirgaria hyperparasitica TaxID=470096 RepID=A0A6A6WAN1_9PEZI|nr:NAD(P)-binding protein [Pseudovirgaria hyperparasitica]KAF2758647.1 NAD(P)-binding protein [Pseudovirgaria hyperparasitica]